MKLSAHFGRRIVAGLSLASAAVLLPTAALATSSAAGAPASPAVIHPCVASQTQVWLGIPADAATGHRYYQLQFSNFGSTACTFFGYPGVSELNIHGAQVGLPASHAGAKATITVPPGGTAHVVLVLTIAGFACPGHVLNGSTLRVYPPGQVKAQLLPFSAGACAGKSLMSVDAMHANAGIPFHSIH